MTDIQKNKKRRFVIDAHSDYAIHLFSEHAQGKNEILNKQHLNPLLTAGTKYETIMCGGDFNWDGTDCFHPDFVSKTTQILKEEIQASPDEFYLVSNSFQLNFDDKRIGFIPGIEGLQVLKGETEKLDDLFESGIRNFIITHNNENEFASGCATKTDSGLSKKGKELVKKMNQYKLILDLVHISEKSFFQAIDKYNFPVTVSHSNVKKLANHYRNLTDEQIKLIAEKKGVIGMNFMGLLLDSDIKKVNIDRLIDHIAYIADLVGMEHIGLGPDYADYYIEDLKKWVIQNKHSMDLITYVPGLEKISLLPALFAQMIKRGFNEDEIDLVAGGNYLRFYESAL